MAVGQRAFIQMLHTSTKHSISIVILPVKIHKLNSNLLEGTLSQQLSFDSREGLVRIVVGLFNETKLFPLALVQATLHTVGFLQPL